MYVSVCVCTPLRRMHKNVFISCTSSTHTQATQCCLELQGEMQRFMIQEKSGTTSENVDMAMSVKLGIGVGDFSILHVGGVFKRLEYLCCGPALSEAFTAQDHCKREEVVMSPAAWHALPSASKKGQGFRVKVLKDKFVKVLSQNPSSKQKYRVRKFKFRTGGMSLLRLQRYLPAAVLPKLMINQRVWLGEHRQVTCIFLNLGLGQTRLVNPTPDTIQLIQDIIAAIQNSVYEYEGSINKFMIDDKGSTVLILFGLPPAAHEDDPLRAVMACLRIKQRLHEKAPELVSAIGITSGWATAGLIGCDSRREYSVLGDVVNTSARLMQKAEGTILCDETTMIAAQKEVSLRFKSLPPLKLKGKHANVPVYSPLHIDLSPLDRKEDLDNEKSFQKQPIGRHAECSQVRTAIEQFEQTGAVPCVVVTGSIGTGKTHLLRHVMSKFGTNSTTSSDNDFSSADDRLTFESTVVKPEEKSFRHFPCTKLKTLYVQGDRFKMTSSRQRFPAWSKLLQRALHDFLLIHPENKARRKQWIRLVVKNHKPKFSSSQWYVYCVYSNLFLLSLTRSTSLTCIHTQASQRAPRAQFPRASSRADRER
jgi:class 3 adenylate cyclase